MRVSVFGTQRHDRDSLTAANASGAHDLVFFEARLDARSAALAAGSEAACLFVSDRADAAALGALSSRGVRLLVLRSAGYNHVDLAAARRLGMTVMRVPAYSPHSIAEHAVAMMLVLNRKLHRAHQRVREGDFTLHGLLGFEMRGRTAGIVGTGGIGAALAGILLGFGCRMLAYDLRSDPALAARGVGYCELARLLAESHIVSLHVTLDAGTHHLIDAAAIASMRRGAMLINTSRGGVLDTRAAIVGIKSGQLGALGLDVYEREAGLFAEDRSEAPIDDDDFSLLQAYPNVLITAHQAFYTAEALAEIARVTVGNLDAFARGERSGTEL